MPFPLHDQYWSEVKNFLEKNQLGNQPLIAPCEFAELGGVVYSYTETFLVQPPEVPTLVVHKGMLEQIEQTFLRQSKITRRAVYANAVFVVLTNLPCPMRIAFQMDHVRALELMAQQALGVAQGQRIDRPAKPVQAFQNLTVAGVREAMNARYSSSANDHFGGYEHPNLWDQVRYRQVDCVFAKLVQPLDGLKVLEIGCGIGRNAHLFVEASDYTGIDLSDVAIDKARQKMGDRPGWRCLQMDAMDLKFADGQFDLVVGVEIVEHVQEIDLLLSEVARVLRPGGRFIFNTANRDSLHLQIVRALGLPEFKSTHEHFREFGYQEMIDLLGRHGFRCALGEGIMLMPYLNVPGIDAMIQELTTNDEKITEVLRHLGERVGPEYAYEFALVAIRA